MLDFLCFKSGLWTLGIKHDLGFGHRYLLDRHAGAFHFSNPNLTVFCIDEASPLDIASLRYCDICQLAHCVISNPGFWSGQQRAAGDDVVGTVIRDQFLPFRLDRVHSRSWMKAQA
ncbi:hypothetical protein [Pseudomonas aeruginosa]|uniref:hypothetical protein n=1 Tax=Pseudomonas aeruginosa TaxID=287 RepID=UPI0034E05C3B